MCIFLEDNDEDLFSEAAAHIKIGSGLVEDAKRLEKIAASSTLVEMGQSLPGESLSFSYEDLAALIQYGAISNASRSTIFGFLQAINIANIALGAVAGFLGNGILSLTGILRDYIKFQDYHWDPLAKQPATDGQALDSFEPVLFPYSSTLIQLFTNAPEEGIDKITADLQQELAANKSTVMAYIDRYGTLESSSSEGVVDLTPDFINDFLSKGYQTIDQLFNLLLEGISEIIPLFKYLGTKILNVVNAFYCGLWNAIVEAVLGLVDFVGFILNILGGMGEFWKGPQGKAAQFFELLDEFIQSFFKIDWSKIMAEIIDRVSRLNLIAVAHGITMERIAYFLGAFTGLVMEIIVSFLFSGGTASLAKFGNLGTKFFNKVEAAARGIFTKGISQTQARQAISLLFHYLRQAIALLRRGTEEFVHLVQMFFDELIDLIKLGEEVVEQIIKKFKITPSETRLLDDLKISFVKYDGGVATACKIDLS